MNHKNLTQTRIHFYRTLPLLESNFEFNIKKLYQDKKKQHELIERKNLNSMNYNFYKFIEFKFYEKSLKLYYQNIKDLKENDNTNIILLFFPELLKSANLHIELDCNNIKFSYKDFKIIDTKKSFVEKDIKSFFQSYNNLKNKYNFTFNREEMFRYLEIFLNIYNNQDYELYSEREKKYKACLHYFSPYLRPENFYI